MEGKAASVNTSRLVLPCNDYIIIFSVNHFSGKRNLFSFILTGINTIIKID